MEESWAKRSRLVQSFGCMTFMAKSWVIMTVPTTPPTTGMAEELVQAIWL